MISIGSPYGTKKVKNFASKIIESAYLEKKMFTVWLISRIKGHSFVLKRAPLDVWIQELWHGLINDQVVDIGLLKLNNWGRLFDCLCGL